MLEEKIQQSYRQALKSRDKIKTDYLSFIRAEFKNAAIALRKDKLDDNEVLKILNKQKKRLDDARESITTSGREDLLKQNDQELALLAEYLPKALADDELGKIIDEVISETGASSIKDMGKVMKEVLARVGVRADSRKVSTSVKEKLTPR